MHHIDVIVTDLGSQNPWRFTGLYGWSDTSLKARTCELILDLRQHSSLPWLIGGDLNEVFFHSEKKGGAPKSQSTLDMFCTTFEDCGLYDLGFTGYQFTWGNRRMDGEIIEERLDRFCACVEWSSLFPDAHVSHLDEDFSDHLPLLLKLRRTPAPSRRGSKRFMFENMWIQEESCEQVVKEAWDSVSAGGQWQRLARKVEVCSAALSRWKQETFGGVHCNIRKLEGQLRGERNIQRRRALFQELSMWRRKEEVFWAQRAKADFLKHGDSNSKWFHAKARQRRANNSITRLERGDGGWAESEEEVCTVVVNYYEQLFSSVHSDHSEGVLETIPSRVTGSMNDRLSREYGEEEIVQALKTMGPTKSPGPDGFNALFFQRFWAIVGPDVTSLVLSILNGVSPPPQLNHTHIVLIPKVSMPTRISEYRPISLCNVIYKLVTKVIANRLKQILPAIISDTQSAFTPGRLITDNILLAYEVFHSMFTNSSRLGSMAIKVDMAKAYDRVEWPFLREVMLRMGFRHHWVNTVMACVESASFSFIINGRPMGYVKPSRGLRQGDPISPYLFLFVTEGLIGLLRRAEECNTIRGYRVCRRAPPISHLLFADDSIFFCKASVEQARAIRDLLSEYEAASGQQVNYSKSSVTFGKRLSSDDKDQILQVLQIKEVPNQERYLGLPTYVGRSKKKAFLNIKDRIGRCLAGWMNRLVSWAGREVLIKAVAQAIPTYAMSIFKLPKDLCLSIQALLNRFWWSHDHQKRKIHWIGGDRLCDKKDEGGLGFRDMECFNEALLAKQVWRLWHERDSLVARVLKARYYPSDDVLSARLGHNPSFTWRSLHGARSVIQLGTRWSVGNGNRIKAWEDRWIPRPFSYTPIKGSATVDSSLTVAELIDKEAGCWKEDLVRRTFMPLDADIILQLPLCTSWPEDRLCWHFTSNGFYSVKSAYHLLRAQMKVNNPSSSGGSGRSLWRKIWGLDVPNRIRLFGWRLSVGALPTRGNIARRIQGMDVRCPLCDFRVESEMHILFECPAAVEVWQCSPFEFDLWCPGPDSAITVLLRAANRLEPSRFGDFVAVAWEIWNERNRFLFGQSTGGRRCYSADRAIQFVQQYRQVQVQESKELAPRQSWWTPPGSGTFKLNFDAGRVGENMHGWGFVIRNHVGDVMLLGVRQNMGFSSPEEEEARACHFALGIALAYGYRRLIVEGDCLALIGKLQSGLIPNNSLGFFISDILSLAVSFDFLVWNFVKRGCNEVAHAIAHLQPITLNERIWAAGGPDVVYHLATKDMYSYLNGMI